MKSSNYSHNNVTSLIFANASINLMEGCALAQNLGTKTDDVLFEGETMESFSLYTVPIMLVVLAIRRSASSNHIASFFPSYSFR